MYFIYFFCIVARCFFFLVPVANPKSQQHHHQQQNDWCIKFFYLYFYFVLFSVCRFLCLFVFCFRASFEMQLFRHSFTADPFRLGLVCLYSPILIQYLWFVFFIYFFRLHNFCSAFAFAFMSYSMPSHATQYNTTQHKQRRRAREHMKNKTHDAIWLLFSLFFDATFCCYSYNISFPHRNTYNDCCAIRRPHSLHLPYAMYTTF